MDLFSLKRFLAPLQRRIMGYMAKAVVTAVIDSNEIQSLQLDFGNGEIKDGVQRVQNFGFTSFPKKDAQAIVLFYGGDRSHAYVIAMDDGNFRPKLQEGESATYNAFKVQISLKKDGTIELTNSPDSPMLPTSGVVTGECIDSFTGAPYVDVSKVVKAKKV